MKTSSIAIVLLLAASSVAGARPGGPRLGPRPPKCGKLTAAMVKDKAVADELTAKAYAAALAKQKLTPTTLTSTYQAADAAGKKLAANQFAGPTIQIGYGTGWEFVTDGNGDVWAVDRAPVVVATKTYTICGCPPITHGGAEPASVRLIYTLPAGKQFKGRVSIAYDQHVVAYSYSHATPCPTPP